MLCWLQKNKQMNENRKYNGNTIFTLEAQPWIMAEQLEALVHSRCVQVAI